MRPRLSSFVKRGDCAEWRRGLHGSKLCSERPRGYRSCTAPKNFKTFINFYFKFLDLSAFNDIITQSITHSNHRRKKRALMMHGSTFYWVQIKSPWIHRNAEPSKPRWNIMSTRQLLMYWMTRIINNLKKNIHPEATLRLWVKSISRSGISTLIRARVEFNKARWQSAADAQTGEQYSKERP